MISKLWIPAFIFLILIVIACYFLFFNFTVDNAKEILKEDFETDSAIVCDSFYVDESRCSAFANCYAEKALTVMDEKVLLQFARDVKARKSSAFDSYYLIDGKQIGEDCIAEILNMPANVDVNIINDNLSVKVGTPQVVFNCTDTDGGRNYFLQGQITVMSSAGPLRGSDFCPPNCIPSGSKTCTLKEYFCMPDGSMQSEYYDCPKGCKDNSCI